MSNNFCDKLIAVELHLTKFKKIINFGNINLTGFPKSKRKNIIYIVAVSLFETNY